MGTSTRRRTPFPALSLVGWLALVLLPVFSLPARAQGRPDIFNLEVAASDPGAGDLFACALSLSREQTLVVGSVLDDDLGTDSGSLYVFRRRGGRFEQTAKLLAADGAPEHRLGFAVAVDPNGSRLAAGALFHDAAGEHGGAAYVFRRATDGDGWVEEARLIPGTVGAFDQLGHSVALDGDVLAVGAPGEDTRADAAGTVYVYERGPSGWALVAMLTAAEGDNVGDGLGFAVALDGETLLGGAPFADDGLGAVHVFRRGAGGWQEVQRLTAPQRRAGALFGAAVALDGDQAAIGARLDDGAGDRAGAAWTFRRVGELWEVEQQLPAPGLAAGDELGISVALDGDALAVGARFDDEGAPDSGAVYRYRRRGGVWRFEQKLEAAMPAAGDELGFAVAVEDMEGQADDLVVAGAYRADSEAGPDSGLARLRVEGRNADLTITKGDGRPSTDPGEELVYEIVARNLGPAGVQAARVSDVFPTGLVGCSWTCVAAGDGASCGIAAGQGDLAVQVDLAVGSSALFESTCTVAFGAAGTRVVNLARIEPPPDVADPDPSNNSARDVTQIRASSLTITKTGLPNPVSAGGTLMYTVTVRNTGELPATGAEVTDFFPQPLVCTWTCVGAACGRPGPVTGDLEDTVDLAADTAVTYTARCAVPVSLQGDLTNTATARGPHNETSAQTTTTVTPPPSGGASDLAVQLEIPAVPLSSTRSLLTAVVENRGTAGAEAAVLALDLSPAVPFTELTDVCGASFPCSLGPLAAGERIQIDLELPRCLPEEVGVTAVVTPEDDLDPTNNRDQRTLPLAPSAQCPVDLRVAKSATLPVVNVGGQASFTLQVTNDGPETAFAARVDDPIPSGLLAATWTCTASPGAGCTPAGSGAIADEVVLPPGGTVTYTLTATIASGVCGPITNTAFVRPAAPNLDAQPDDNSASASVLAVPANATCARKIVFPQAQVEGGEIEYTILIVHGGPGALGGPGPEFEDTVPEGLTVVGATADRGTATSVGNTVRWDGILEPGESVLITILATVDPQTLGLEICNQGTVFAEELVLTDDPDEPGTEDPTCLTVVAFIPTLSPGWMALLAALLAALGIAGLRRRRHDVSE